MHKERKPHSDPITVLRTHIERLVDQSQMLRQAHIRPVRTNALCRRDHAAEQAQKQYRLFHPFLFLRTKIGAPMYFTKKYPKTFAHPSPKRQLTPQSFPSTEDKNIFIPSLLKENEKVSDKNFPRFASSKKSRIFAPGLSNEPTSFHGTLRKRTVIQR